VYIEQFFIYLFRNSQVPEYIVVTFRVSRRPREMYCGHARLCVCLCVSVCLCVCPRPHAHTVARTRMQLGGVVGDAT